jgi:4-methyl-5(b-hydroxyethyl)-thiazole monophosphate biosynthesis
MPKKLAIIAGHNFEETELVGTVDVLRRAQMKVDIVSFFNEEMVTGSHGIELKPDVQLKDFQEAEYDGLIIPGGSGVDHLNEPLIEQDNLLQLIKTFYNSKRLVAAICAAPEILAKAGLLEGKDATHFPSSRLFMENVHEKTNLPVIVNANDHMITGRSAGTVFEFALAIVEYYLGEKTRDEVAYKQLVLQH